MHVLILPSWYKTDANPVSGSFFEEQARGLMRCGYKVGIFHIGFRPFSDISNLVSNNYSDNGLATIQMEFRAFIPYNRSLNYRHLCGKAYRAFNEYVKQKGRPDVLHAHSVFYGGIVAKYISKRTNIPFVITEHLTDFITTDLPAYDLKSAKSVFEKSSANILVSNSFKKKLSEKLKLPETDFTVIHNMVSPVFFNQNRTKYRKVTSPVFFTNSFISERKNISLLIRAFILVQRKYPDALLLIGGDAVREQDRKYKNELIQLILDLKLSTHIIFLGALSREQVKENIFKSHIALLASKFETFGVFLIEALAGGVPVISTDSLGPRDIINDANGVIVASFDEKDFSEAMMNMVVNYDFYNAVAIAEHCKTHFSEEVIIGKLIELYRKITN